MPRKALTTEEAKAAWEKEWRGGRQTRLQRAFRDESECGASGVLTETIEVVLGEEGSGGKRADVRQPVLQAPANTRRGSVSDAA